MPEPLPSRRDLLRAGTAVAGAAALSGCGGGSGGASPAPSAATTTALRVLGQALTAEHAAVFAYTQGRHLLGSVTAPLCTAFAQNHADHIQRLGELIRALGGTPAPARSISPTGPAPTDEQGVVTLAATLEEQATLAHYAALSRIADPATVQILGSIMADEAEHAATLRTVLQEDPAPDPVVTR